MKILSKAFWLVMAFLAASATAVVVGIVNPAEKVNALWSRMQSGDISQAEYDMQYAQIMSQAQAAYNSSDPSIEHL